MTTFQKSAVGAAMCALCFASVASAANVNVYGTVDTGFRWTNAKGGEDTFELVSGDNLSPAVGIEGSETLANGTDIFFKLEQGFYIDDGSMAFEGRMFGRESTVGLRGSFGTIAIGRMGSIGSAAGSYDMTCALDPFGAGYTDAGIQATMIETSRLDNAITYVTPEWAGFTATVQYSNQIGYAETSQEAPEWNENTRYASLGLHYGIGGLNASLLLEREFTPTSRNADDAYFITTGLSYDFGFFTLYGTYQHAANYGTTNSQFYNWWSEVNEEDYVDSNNSYMLGVGKSIGNAWLMASVQYMDAETVSGEDVERKVAAVGATYNLTKRTSVYGAFSWSDATGSLEDANLDRTVLNFGLSHTF